MTEVRFYHLIEQRLERVLPQLLELSLQRGWRVVVQASSDERVEALDASSVDLSRRQLSAAWHNAQP